LKNNTKFQAVHVTAAELAAVYRTGNDKPYWSHKIMS